MTEMMGHYASKQRTLRSLVRAVLVAGRWAQLPATTSARGLQFDEEDEEDEAEEEGGEQHENGEETGEEGKERKRRESNSSTGSIGRRQGRAQVSSVGGWQEGGGENEGEGCNYRSAEVERGAAEGVHEAEAGALLAEHATALVRLSSQSPERQELETWAMSQELALFEIERLRLQ